ncbi:hypothetical protein FH972_012434 [Carpinus fangiana]|uniref:Uncharacterized protein n=1 Tax=Carpinus fangiana TaxID=176857 RepID=A0A5N6R657_9ROSI|nr:hypothetical protein FH972_012434 [Carpinus fangiana]
MALVSIFSVKEGGWGWLKIASGMEPKNWREEIYKELKSHESVIMTSCWFIPENQERENLWYIPENVDFNAHRKIEAYYKWVGNLLEIKLQPALSPQVLTDLNDDLTQFHLLAERVITRRDRKDREIHIPQMDVRPFYDICTDELRQAINAASSISVQIFPPGEMGVSKLNVSLEYGAGEAGGQNGEIIYL